MLSPNQLLNRRYRVVEKCGKGGMGTVYRAEDERLALTVAIKECAFERPDLRRLFTQEARLVARLRHRTIARVIDHFEEGDCQYLVMDFVPGDTLADIPPSRLTLDRIHAWGDALLEALAFLHGHEPPIVHRDIKPHNIKLWPDDTPVLLDFGLAKGGAPASHTIPSRSVVGYTPHYAALEQMQGSGTDARSDVYSFSATMYRLLTGAVPPDAMTRVEATNDGRPDPLRSVVALAPHVPAPLAAIVEKGMATAKSARFASAEDMRRVWATCRPAHGASTHLHSTVTLPAPPTAADPGEALTIRPAAAVPLPAEPLPAVPVTPALAPLPAPQPPAPPPPAPPPVHPLPAPARQAAATSSTTAPTPASIIAAAIFVGLMVAGLVFGVPAWESGRLRTGAPPPPATDGTGPESSSAGGQAGDPGGPGTPPPAPAAGSMPTSAPQVVAWEAEPADIVAGESTTLRWRVKDAVDLEITPGIGTVDPRGGSLTVAPTTTTTYRLQSPSRPSLAPMAITVAVAEPLETLAGFAKQWEFRDAAPVGSDWLAVALELKGTQHHLGQVVVVPIRDTAARPRVLTTWRGDLFGGMVGTPDGRLITGGRAYSVAERRDLGPFEGPLAGVRFSGDGKIAVAPGRTVVDERALPAVGARDGRTGRWLWQAPLEGRVIDVALSPDGTRVAAAFDDVNQRRVAILDALTGKRLRVLELWPSAIAWTGASTLAVAEPGKGVVFANTETGQASFRNHLEGPLVVSPDGRWLAAHNAGGPVLLTSLRPGQNLQLPVRAPHLAFTSDSRLLVTWGAKAVEVYSIPEGSRVGSLP